MARRDQIIKIKIAQKQLNVSDDNYRDILSGFNAASCTELTDRQADEMLELFRKLGFKETRKEVTEKEKAFGTRSLKYENLGKRPGKATPGQLRKIETMWRNVSREKTDKSLQSFVKSRTGTTDLTWISGRQASDIIVALNKMAEVQ